MSRVVLTASALCKRHYHGAHTGYIALRSLFDKGEDRGGFFGRFLSRYGEPFWALKDVSFAVEAGERLAIIGGNGAGKSTLLKILARVVRPTSGRATYSGRMAALLEVGTGFNTDLTGRENVYVNAAVMGADRNFVRRRFDEIVAFAEVEDAIDTPMKFYSSGMRTRLAFSIAAFLEPDILIADEVLAVGDAKFQRKCLQQMTRFGAEGHTIIFVSHSMPQVLGLCRRGIWLDHGRIQMDGPVNEVAIAYGNQLPMTAEKEGDRWTPEPVAPATLRRLRACNAAGQPATQFDVREPIVFELYYEVRGDQLRVMPEITLCGADDIELLVTGPRQSRQLSQAQRPGRYIGRVTIPGDLLKEGLVNVSVRALAFDRHETVYESKNTLTLYLSDKGAGDSARGDYLGPIGGVIQPKLDWSIERCQSAWPEGPGAASAGAFE